MRHVTIPMAALLAVAAPALAESFIVPFSGNLYMQAAGGSAGAVSTFGIGTSQSNYVPYITGLPVNPSPKTEVLVGSVVAGQTVVFGISTSWNNQSYWAFSNSNDRASVVAFTDTANQLGMGGKIIQQTSATTWLMHLDDAASYLFDDNNADILIQLRLDRTSTPSPTLQVTPPTLTFTYRVGGPLPSPQTVSVASATAAGFSTVASVANWLSVTTLSTVTPATVSVGVIPAGLAPGSYSASITFTSPTLSSSQIVSVSLTVAPTSPSLQFSANSLSFSYQIGATTSPPPQTIAVKSSGAETAFSVAGQSAAWLGTVVSSTSTPATVSVYANPAGLAAGTYSGNIIFTLPDSSNANQSVTVSLTVLAAPPPPLPTLQVSPASVSFNYQVGGASPSLQKLSITTTSAATTFSFSTPDVPWISVTSSSLTTPSIANVSVNPLGLSIGTYSTTLTVSAPATTNLSQSVSVTLIVVPAPPRLQASPPSLSFAYSAGANVPISQSIAVSSTSTQIPFAVKSTGAVWLNATSVAQNTPGDVIVSVDPTGLTVGNYSGSIVISASGTEGGSLTIPVALVVRSDAPQPIVQAVLNGASYGGNVAPGTWVAIYGTNLANTTGASTTVPLPTSLGGTTVAFSGIPAPLLYVSPTQINAVVPFNLPITPSGYPGASVTVTTSARVSSPIGFNTSQGSPGLFSVDGTGTGTAVAFDSSFNQIYSVPSGPLILYADGLGPTSPPASSASGGASSEPLNRVVNRPRVFVGDNEATVTFAGLAPGFPGIYQLNVIPNSPKSDRVYVQSGGWQSNIVSLPVQAGTNATRVSGTIKGLYPPVGLDGTGRGPGPVTSSAMLIAGTFTVDLDIRPGAQAFSIVAASEGGNAIIDIDPANGSWRASLTEPTARSGGFQFGQSVSGFDAVYDFLACVKLTGCQVFPGNNIPSTRVDPAAALVVKALPLPTSCTGGCTTANALYTASGTLPAGGHFSIGQGTLNNLVNFGGFIQIPQVGPPVRSTSFRLYVDGRLIASDDETYPVYQP